MGHRPNRDLVGAILWTVGLLALLGGLLLLGRHYSQPSREFRESVAEIDEVLVLIREFCQRNRAELQQIPADPRARFCDEHGYLYP